MADRINLTDSNSTTPPIAVPLGAAKLSIGINDDAGTYTWGAAVVDLQYSLLNEPDEDGTDLSDWVNFDPAIQFTTTKRSRRAIGVTGAGWVRLKVSTPDSGADINAVVTMVRNWNA